MTKTRANQSSRRPWTQRELDLLRERYGHVSAAELAQELGRSLSSVYQRAKIIGVVRGHIVVDADFDQRLRALHAQGLSDAAMADIIKCSRHTVGDARRRLALPTNNLSEWRRRRVALKTREQLRAAGLKSLADVRVKSFRDRARRAGWPEDLRPRAVQMLNALWDRGPMTRRQLADAIGMPWKGSRKSLASNDPEGSYLAHLMKRGLVICLGRANKVHGQGKGRSTCVYSLPLWIERTPIEPEVQHAKAS